MTHGKDGHAMPPIADSIKLYRDAYAAAGGALPGARTRWVRDLREQALEHFTALGFPTTRLEDWKYTSVAPIERAAFKPALRAANGVAAAELEALGFEGLEVHRLVFVDGHYSEALSSAGRLPDGALVTSLAAVLERGPERVEPYLSRHAPTDKHALAALNAAFFADGACIVLGRNVTIDKPIHLVFLSTRQGEEHMLPLRNLVVAGEGSRASVIEHYVGFTEARYFTSVVTEVVAAPASQVEHYRLQRESLKAFHVGGLYVHMEKDCRFTANAVDLGGLLVRNDVRGVLDAPGAVCVLNGLYVVDGRAHVDNHTLIEHAKPYGTSREFYKGVLDGRARAVFNGRIVVHPDAQHTDAQQENRNLLLSEDAEVDTRPQLEIYADDVKCSHGATVGNLDADALFYLRSRAVDEQAARDLLTYAFANDVLARWRLAPLRLSLEHALSMRLLHGRTIRELELV